jgi:hypothetical protein
MNEESMRIIKRVTGKRIEMTGNAELQSLMANALPEKPITVDVALLSNGCDGYLMRYQAMDAALAGTAWHTSVPAAENHANVLFGLRPSDWQTMADPNENTTPRQLPTERKGGGRAERSF